LICSVRLVLAVEVVPVCHGSSLVAVVSSCPSCRSLLHLLAIGLLASHRVVHHLVLVQSLLVVPIVGMQLVFCDKTLDSDRLLLLHLLGRILQWVARLNPTEHIRGQQ